MRDVYLMSGLPGSGKSTYIEKAKWEGEIVLHRDEFRSGLREKHQTTDYFPVSAAEEFNEWTKLIGDTLTNNPDKNIWIDQTTLSVGSLDKLLAGIADALLVSPSRICVMRIIDDLETCWLRNKDRNGDALVPRSVMESMAKAAPITQADCDMLAERYMLPIHVYEHHNERMI